MHGYSVLGRAVRIRYDGLSVIGSGSPATSPVNRSNKNERKIQYMDFKNINVAKIPEELKAIKHWVGFTVENGRKVPVDPNPSAFASPAKINDPMTWGSFEQAVKLVENDLAIGVGFAITKDTGLIFVDLDCHTDSVDDESEKKKIEQYFRSFCTQAKIFDTYMETSISGNGVHLLARGELLEGYKTGHAPNNIPIELYNDKRFALLTGHTLNDWGISDSEKTIGAIHNLQKHYFPKVSPALATGLVPAAKTKVGVLESQVYEDDVVLQAAMRDSKFQLLWGNRWNEVMDAAGQPLYSSQHFADYALIQKLIYYTHNCPAQAERLFRLSPCYQAYGKNGKWPKNESDIKNDLKTASAGCTAVYEPKAEVIDLNNDWQPDFDDIINQLDNGALTNLALKNRLLNYIGKYRYEDIHYVPYLHTFDMNVNGNTQIVRAVLGDQLIYSNKMSSFFKWNGKKYEMVDEDVLYHVITEVLAMVEHSIFMWTVTEVMGADNVDVVKTVGQTELTERDISEEKAMDYFSRCSKMVTIKNCADIFKKLKGMYLNWDLMDYQQSPYINLENGVFDLSTKELLPHSTDYRLHKIMGYAYDPAATCPTFDTMLETLFPDEAVRKEMLKAFGLCLAKEQLPAKKALFLLVGEKDTGKTTLVNIVNSVLGEYGKSIDNSVLMRRQTTKSNVGPELLELRDTLFISTSEVSQDARLDGAKVKAMTGNTIISTRNLYDRKMITFSVVGLIFIDSNYKPFLDNDDALWGRLKIFPFTQVITSKDKTLQKKLEAEKSGIFNRLLEGLQMVLDEGEIIECPAMLAAKEQYKTEMTVTEQFISDCLIMSDTETDRVPTTRVFEAYQNWCRDNGFHTMIRNKFYSEIGSYLDRKKSGTEYFIRVRLSELGYLYSHMKEKTPQQFAKDKNRILDGTDDNLTYEVLRKTYYQRAIPWFAENVVSTTQRTSLYTQYTVYAEWCIRHNVMPLIATDFNRKAGYIFDNLTSNKPTQEQLIKAGDVWN